MSLSSLTIDQSLLRVIRIPRANHKVTWNIGCLQTEVNSMIQVGKIKHNFKLH